MKRPTLLLIITFLAMHAATGTEAAYVVAGEIAVSDVGFVYVELVTEETFGRNGTSPYRTVLQPVNGVRSLAFRFDSIPPGRYVLRAFQDENGDGRLNLGPFGPREPVGMHRWTERLRIPPRFETSAFAVDGNVTDIRIELH